MHYNRMPIEVESPEELGYSTIHYNLAESSVRDRTWQELNLDLSGLTISYGEHRGKLALRQLIADESPTLCADDVLITSGAATALFIVATTLLNSKDHLVVIRPNYSTNLETPRAIGCTMSVIDLAFENEFDFSIEQIRAAIQPNTRLISITNPHNPTGKVFDELLVNQLISLVEEKGIYLLMDETYRDLNFQSELLPYQASKSKRVISVCSLSKAFGVPGIRTGWLICQDKALMHNFLAAKEQIIITNSVVDEEIAYQLVVQKQSFLLPIHTHIRANFALLQTWFAQQPYLEWVEPQAGVVAFPRIKTGFQIDIEHFYHSLYHNYQTLVGAGHWFEREKIYFRLGFGFPTAEELSEGLRRLQVCLSESQR